MKRAIILFLMFVLFAGTVHASDQWTSFRTNNSDTDYIYHIVTEGNTIWCATNGGIVKWDTVTGTYTVEKTGRFLSAAIDRDGVKWFGGDQSVYALKDTVLISFTKSNTQLLNKSDGAVRSITIDIVNKRIICGFFYTYSSHQGVDIYHYALLSYDGEKWEELYDYSQPFQGLPLVVDTVNPWDIWGCGISYYYLFEKTAQGYTKKNFSLDAGQSNVTSLAIDRDNGIWMTSNDIFYYDRNNLIKYSSNVTGAIGLPRNMAIDRNQIKWFGSSGALVRYDDKTWSTFPFQPLDEQDRPSALAADVSGDIWMGRISDAKGNGLWRFHPTQTGVDEDSALPRAIIINGNYPNPFNPSTTIDFTLPSSGAVILSVYNITGQKVRELVNGPLSAGAHSVVWDGRDFNGNPVSSGVYISRLSMGNQTVTRCMLLAK